MIRLSPEISHDQAASIITVAAREILRHRHHLKPGQADDFTLLTARQSQEVKFKTLKLVHTVGLIASTICFGVGGMRIFSIITLMVMVVHPRRLEIGIRRAVGSRCSLVLRQLFIESGLISIIGATLGLLSSLGLTWAVNFF